MAQDYIKINGVKIWQPDCDRAVALETTYTQGSTRAQSGKGKFTPMFTVERFPYTATDIPMSEASKILQMVAKGKPFDLHYFSVYHNEWRTAKFYVGQVSDIKIQTLEKNKEKLSSFSFNAQGVNPI